MPEEESCAMKFETHKRSKVRKRSRWKTEITEINSRSLRRPRIPFSSLHKLYKSKLQETKTTFTEIIFYGFYQKRWFFMFANFHQFIHFIKTSQKSKNMILVIYKSS